MFSAAFAPSLPRAIFPGLCIARVRAQPYDPQNLRQWIAGFLATWIPVMLLVGTVAALFGCWPRGFTWLGGSDSAEVRAAALRSAALIMLVSLASPALWLIWMHHPARRPRLAAARRRRARLAALAGHPQGGMRLPHRIVEHAACCAPLAIGTRCYEAALTALPPGVTVFVAKRPQEFTARLVPITEPFEPVAMDDEDACAQLLLEHGADSPDAGEKSNHSRRPLRRQWLQYVLGGLQSAGLLFGLVLFVVAWFRGTRGPLLMSGVIVGLMGLASVVGWLLGRRELLVPGAFVLVRQPTWRAVPHVEIVRRADTPLIVVADDDEAHGVARYRGAQRVFSLDAAALSAWLSTARSPTDEEIVAFLN